MRVKKFIISQIAERGRKRECMIAQIAFRNSHTNSHKHTLR